MTATTIKVSRDLRDRLKKRAEEERSTLGEYLESLLEADLRRQWFLALRRQMAENPPDEEYYAELREWQSDAWS